MRQWQTTNLGRSPVQDAARFSPRLARLYAPLLFGILFAATSCSSTNGAGHLAQVPVVSSSPNAVGALAMTPVGTVGDANLASKEEDEEIEEAIVSVDNKVEEEDLPGAPVGDEISHATTEKIPLEINADVERWIEYFTVKDRERFQRFMERGEKYKPMILAVLRDQGIPTELFYQAMIESGFATHATSHASAVGIWQFIPGTGKRYGLRIDQYVDERRDPMRATIAASLYMKDLYNVFQSWYLAMAAYNAGEGRILGAIMRAKTRDFWEMVSMKALPSETLNYIPKFLAATIIAHNPQKYGMEDLSIESMPTLASVAVPAPVRLTDIAKVTDLDLKMLREYNPHLLKGVTPPGSTGQYRIWVPKDRIEQVEEKETALAALRLRGLPSGQALASGSKHPQFHRVKRGETLSKISARYNVSIAALRKMNNMRSNLVRAGTQIRVSPKTSGSYRSTAGVSRYRVRRGDNLNVIAKKFNMSLGELKKLNKLRRNTIYAGQVLRVAPDKG